LTKDKLEELDAPMFDPLFELESEIDYAFTPVCFETIFRNKLIDNAFVSTPILVQFKSRLFKNTYYHYYEVGMW
jgi:hypothetical protein